MIRSLLLCLDLPTVLSSCSAVLDPPLWRDSLSRWLDTCRLERFSVISPSFAAPVAPSARNRDNRFCASTPSFGTLLAEVVAIPVVEETGLVTETVCDGGLLDAVAADSLTHTCWVDRLVRVVEDEQER